MEIDKLLLDASLARLHHLVPSQVELARLVSEVVHAVTEIFDLTGAGVLVVDADRALRSIAASDSSGALLERAQEEFGEGPCVESFIIDEIVLSEDLATDTRWPRVTPVLLDGGIRAVLGVPVRLGGGPIGTLNVASDAPRVWTDSERDAMVHFGAVLENLLLAGLIADRNDKLARQLQYALEYRVPIERAVGYLMATMRTDPISAFETLRRTARNERRRVSELAGEILARRRVL
ncbi:MULTISPECIES: GAF and ANTAR domain-containing protein [Frankia]|uniref:Transcriptional activator protein traR n=1 Tax=Frankia alni (strain DSM 45986 / CECT 9034 / ACN14a) TaxID=326424 RepID=Q0RBE3_FRAAA|nr:MULTISPECIES: GAF and ANTAR domain-containing protein [Frankia]CAJ65243.1 putative Transcriptional activator protein traR [Frankia alni ACN14a]